MKMNSAGAGSPGRSGSDPIREVRREDSPAAKAKEFRLVDHGGGCEVSLSSSWVGACYSAGGGIGSPELR